MNIDHCERCGSGRLIRGGLTIARFGVACGLCEEKPINPERRHPRRAMETRHEA